MGLLRPRSSLSRGELVLLAGMLAFVLLLPWYLWGGALRVVYRLGLIAAAVAAIALSWGRRTWPGDPLVTGFAAAYTALAALSTLLSTLPLESGAAASRFLLRGFVAFLVVASAFGTVRLQDGLRVSIALSGLGIVLGAWLLFALQIRDPWGGLLGPSLDYNSLCMWLVPCAQFVIALACREERPRGWTAAAVVMCASVALTFSRIGWVAFAVSLGLWLWLVPRSRARILAVAAAGLLLFVIVGPPLANALTVTDNNRYLAGPRPLDASVMKRMSLLDVLTMNDRLRYAWLPALALAREHPVLGAGYGPETFAWLGARGRVLLTHEHNQLLAVAVQCGGLGLLAFLGMLLAVAARFARQVRQARSHPERAWAVAALSAVVAEYGVQGLGEPTNNGVMGILLFVLAGLAAAPCPPEEPAGPAPPVA